MRHLMASGLLCFGTILAAALAGCDDPEAAQNQPAADEATENGATNADTADASDAGITLVNAVCPIEGGKAKTTVTTDWNGKTVGFCCPPCIPEWEKLTLDEQTAKLAVAAEAAGDAAEENHDTSANNPS